MSLERHSPAEQPSIDTSKEKEAEKLTKEHENLWPKLIGRANEDQI